MFVSKQTQRLFENQANVVAIYPLQGQATESVPDWIEDFLMYLDGLDRANPLFDALPAIKNLVSNPEWPTDSDVLEALQFGSEAGFLFYGEWERREYISENSFYGGPGIKSMFWAYADTIDAGFDAVILAAEAHHESQKAKAGAA